ncbi:unnamed protein product, partial [Urochloa humidicola]
GDAVGAPAPHRPHADHTADAGPLPDFTVPVAVLPGVTVLYAGSSAHPNLGRHPFIITAAPASFLASFTVAPFNGHYMGDTHLVVAHHLFRRTTAEGQISSKLISYVFSLPPDGAM